MASLPLEDLFYKRQFIVKNGLKIAANIPHAAFLKL